MNSDKKKKKDKPVDDLDSLNSSIEKGPHKDEHKNPYGKKSEDYIQ